MVTYPIYISRSKFKEHQGWWCFIFFVFLSSHHILLFFLLIRFFLSSKLPISDDLNLLIGVDPVKCIFELPP